MKAYLAAAVKNSLFSANAPNVLLLKDSGASLQGGRTFLLSSAFWRSDVAKESSGRGHLAACDSYSHITMITLLQQAVIWR